MTGEKTSTTQVVTVIVVGIIGWVVAGVIALAMGAEGKIIATCAVGALLGAIGLRYSIRRAARSGI